MNIITVPAWEERIDIKPLTPRAKAALARYYAAEMIGELSLQGDCDELAVVLGVAPEYNPLQMIEGWILHRLRFVCEVDLLSLVYEFRQLYQSWSYQEACGLLECERDGNGNPIDDNPED